MSMKIKISRRTVLRGLGAAVALPWLETMGPLAAWADDQPGVKKAPNRLAFIYVPNGKNMADWTPAAEGANYTLPAILEPLEKHKADFNVLTGLTADKARPHGDGGGDHARALAAFLTGAQPRKTDGTDIRAGTSVDQVAASRIGDRTRLASLEIGCEQGGMAGNCDSGYSCVYSNTMSWRSAAQPLPKEVNPKLVFERLLQAHLMPTAPAEIKKNAVSLIWCAKIPKTLQERSAPLTNANLTNTSPPSETSSNASKGHHAFQRLRLPTTPSPTAFRRLPRAYPPDVRSYGSCFPGRCYSRCNLCSCQRGQQQALPFHWRLRRPSRSFPSRQR